MKLTKSSKILALVLCAALLVGGSVMATVAYLQDAESVVNTFTVGKVVIKLDETKVNAEGIPVTPAERTEDGNAYHLIPGQTYVKDPAVTIKEGSEPSYVRMLVTLNKATALKAAFGNNFLPQNYVNGTWDASIWPCVGVTEANDTITYEFRYYKVTDKATADIELEPLFENFTLPGSVKGDQLETLQGFEIKVVAHAIQAAGFEEDTVNNLSAADVAWAAFDADPPTGA